MPAQTIVLRGVIGGFHDDNFRDGWGALTVGGQTFTTDGDVVTITGISNVNVPPGILKNVSINPFTFGRFVARYRSLANGATCQAVLLFSDLSVQTMALINPQSTSWQLDNEAIVAPVGTTIIQIQLFIGNANPSGMSAQFDIVCVESATAVDITNNILGGSSTNYVGKTATCNLKLQNEPPNAKYLTSPNVINISDMLLVWSADVFPASGPAKTEKAFGGKIVGMPASASKDGDAKKFLNIAAKGWGLGIERVTNSLIQLGLPDETIVGNIIDQVNTAGQGWNLSKSIADVLSVNALDWLPEKRTAQQNLANFSDWLSARRVAAVALNGSSDRGADWWVSPSEVFTWQTIGVMGSVASYAQDPDLSSVQIEQFGDPIINQIDLVGETQYPVDGDALTEGNSAAWSIVNGTLSDDATHMVGAKSIKLLTTAGSVAVTTGLTPVYTALDFTKMGNQSFHPVISFYARRGTNTKFDNQLYIGMYDNTNAKFWLRNLNMPNAGQWYQFNFDFGPYAPQDVAISSDSWTWTGTPISFANIIQTKFQFAPNAAADANSYLEIDGLSFQGVIVETAYDQTSIDTHGLTEIVLRETALHEPIEHRRLARGHLYKWRLPTWMGSVTFAGWKSHQPGDIITLTLPDLNQTSKLYRVLSVTQKLPVGSQAAITSVEVTDQMVNLAPAVGTPNFLDIMKASGIPPIQTELAWNVFLATLVQNIPTTKTEVGTAI